MTEVAIDTAADVAGVALTGSGELLAEVTWRTRQNQSRELLPALDWLLSSRGLTREEVGAVFVCLGPGSYAGLRVGLSTAKGLAYALNVPLVGVGRLAADAEPLALEGGRAVYAVHAAGRAELAWAAYERRAGELVELIAPRLSGAPVLVEALTPGAVVCGDVASLAGALPEGVATAAGHAGRVVSIARLGYARLRSGSTDDPRSLAPLYLREPAIGPQPQR